LQSFIQDAKAFSDLINPAILKIDFDTADVERLYNIVDYSVVSQHHEPVEHNFTSASLAANPDIAQWLSFGNEKTISSLMEAYLVLRLYYYYQNCQTFQPIPIPAETTWMSSHFIIDPGLDAEYLEIMSQLQPNSNIYSGHQL
jgi:hypothetical protein